MTEADTHNAASSTLIPGQTRFKRIVGSALDLVEDVVYIGLGVLLASAAVWLLFSAGWTFVHELVANTLSSQLIGLLDQILLVLLILELLYTVQVSFREHSLVTEPFLIIALIATVRKLLVLTAQIPQSDLSNDAFHRTIVELSLLSGMVVVLVVSLILLRRQAGVHKDEPHVG